MKLLNPPAIQPPRSTWGNLFGESDAFIISRLTHDGLTLIITPDQLSAVRLEEALLFFGLSNDLISIMPDWETLPYDRFSPHEDIISQRLLILKRLQQNNLKILIISVTTLLHHLPPTEFVEQYSFVLSKGDVFNLTTTRERLTTIGYHCVEQVLEHGEFSIRGSIIDIFPMGSPHPLRIDLFDDEVDSIRTFDPETQRSIDKQDKIQLLPAKEYPLTDDAISQFRNAWREHFKGNPSNCPVYNHISDGIPAPGVEYFLPLFFDNTATLFDYLSETTTIITLDGAISAAPKFITEVKERYEQLRHNIDYPILPPTDLFLSEDQLHSACNQYTQLSLQKQPIESPKAHKRNFDTQTIMDVKINNKAKTPLHALKTLIAETNKPILLTAESLGRMENLLNLLKSTEIQPKRLTHWQDFLNQKSPQFIGISVANLEHGFCCDDFVIIPEAQILGQPLSLKHRKSKHRGFDPEVVIRNLAEIRLHAPVVHIDHGVGRYAGLKSLSAGGCITEFLQIEYDNKDILYVPVTDLNTISLYSGGDLDHAPLHRLGSEQWAKAKKRAAKKIRDVAAELLAIYAKRAAKSGFRFDEPDEQYTQFCADFPFEETPDQTSTIQSVIKDMNSDQPMDRLVCGDVGFGKTEVAMRAAFIAAENNKQTAILVPTTLLAQQHYETFTDRFAPWPIRIELLSRFVNAKQSQQVIDDLASGKVDIVIGTHKLIQEKIKYQQLGLLILDEEHRFGVRQKEKIKRLRTDVDILTLTATPIPRTLNMAMSAIRDLSIIATPPAKRLSVKTFVKNYDHAIIREAVLREILRGGQVYFLHNDVASIERMCNTLQDLIPEASCGIGHGQMHERKLERAMSDFYHQRFNVLICSTIIETGIDIPSANTIIINRADKFGLAQLHQLRGRVGRSHHQAYAYLLTPQEAPITRDAEKRLDAIVNLEDLGAGFALATQDLEIRGAGELLGEEQSGNIQEIGFTLYHELLERTVSALQKGESFDIDAPTSDQVEVNLPVTCLIPETFIHDIHTRLQFYKRIADETSIDKLDNIHAEMIDRFGLLPEAVKNLFQLSELRIQAKKLGIQKIDVNKEFGKLTFTDNPAIKPETIIHLIQTKSQYFQLAGPNGLKFSATIKSNIFDNLCYAIDCLK